MELKDFVKKVVKDLIGGIDEVNNESSREVKLYGDNNQRAIEFDIAVSIESSKTATGEAGINVLEFVRASGDITKDTKNSTVSRVKFGIFVSPVTRKQDRLNSTTMSFE